MYMVFTQWFVKATNYFRKASFITFSIGTFHKYEIKYFHYGI